MQYITRYQKDNDGTYSVVATGVELEQSHIDLLENGYPLKAEVEVPDNKKLSIEQRKKIFAMCRDIELHWGEPVESTRKLLQTELEIMKGYEEISLRDCSMKVAGVYLTQSGYVAQITYKRKTYHIGWSKNIYETALMFNKINFYLHGSDVILNDVPMTDELKEFISNWEIPDKIKALKGEDNGRSIVDKT